MTIFISDAGRTKAKKAKISLNNDAKMFFFYKLLGMNLDLDSQVQPTAISFSCREIER